jgi:hypothetical protein
MRNSWSLYVLLSLIIILAVVIRVSLKRALKPGQKEGFGTSPGTMVQLSTSHVPTEDEIYYYKHVYPKLVRKEIYEMTESDL